MASPSSSPSPSGTVACPSCGQPASGRFCANCGAPLAGARCPSCNSELSAGARFCHHCGAAVGASRAAPPGLPTDRPITASAAAPVPSGGIATALPWAVAGIALVALIALIAGQRFGARPAPAAAAGDAGAGGPPAGAIPAGDISQMSPRERADRLYDRIMRLDSEGKKDSVAFFAPMGIQAFQMIPDLDLDARYDMGRVAEVTGAIPLAKAQADTILKQDPTHLLGLTLAMRLAEQSGDTKSAASYAKRLIAAEPAERKKALPEYQRHDGDIQDALVEARKLQ